MTLNCGADALWWNEIILPVLILCLMRQEGDMLLYSKAHPVTITRELTAQINIDFAPHIQRNIEEACFISDCEIFLFMSDHSESDK